MAKRFYRVGKDLFNADTGQRITGSDWAKNWSGKAKEVSAPTPTSNNYTGRTSTTSGGTVIYEKNGGQWTSQPPETQQAYTSGTGANPNQFTPEQAAQNNLQSQRPSEVISTSEVPVKQTEQDLLNELYDLINSSGLSEAEKSIAKQIAKGNYTSGQAIPTQQELFKIISDATTAAESDLDVPYARTTQQTLADLKRQMEDIRKESDASQAKLTTTYKEQLQKTKDALRARGLTFSGTPIKTLGQQAALRNTEEGTLPSAYRVGQQNITQEALRLAREAGIKGERELGTDPLKNINFGTLSSGENLYKPIGGSGDNPLEPGELALKHKKDVLESSLNRLRGLIPT